MKKLFRILRYDWPLHFVLLFTNWLPDNVVFLRLRGWLASPFLGKCEKDLRLGRDITFYNPSKVEIGKHVYIAKGCWFLGYERIIIGHNTIFGPYVVVVTANHSFSNGGYRDGVIKDIEPVCIKEGVWIAAHVTVLPGSQIDNGTLIAANSVFKGISDSGGVYAGVPAKKIKDSSVNYSYEH